MESRTARSLKFHFLLSDALSLNVPRATVKVTPWGGGNVFNLYSRPRSTKDGIRSRKGGEGEGKKKCGGGMSQRSSGRRKNRRFYSR